MKDFGLYPSVKFNRTKFDLSHGVKTSMNVGTLYPIDIQEVLPGDTFSNKTTAVARVSSGFAKPVLDNCWLDLYTFFVPLRLCFDEAEKVFGVASPSMYTTGTLSTIPVTSASSTVTSKSVADYLGLPLGTVPKGVSILPFRAFALIYNQWFRNENVVDEVYVQQGSYNASAETINSNAWSPSNYTGMLPKVAKKKDYFTSCLPKPQKGGSVYLPLGLSAPVKTSNQQTVTGAQIAMNFNKTDGTDALSLGQFDSLYMFRKSGAAAPNTGSLYTGDEPVGVQSSDLSSLSYYPNNLYADLTSAMAVNVNDLRFAFQLQKMLERDALYG